MRNSLAITLTINYCYFQVPVYALYSFHKGLRILLKYDSKWREKLAISVKVVIYAWEKFLRYAASLKPHKIPQCVWLK